MAEKKELMKEEDLEKVSGGFWQVERYYILDCKCSCGSRVYGERRAADGSNDCHATCPGCGTVYHMTVSFPTQDVTDAIYTVTAESGTGTIVENNCHWVNKY